MANISVPQEEASTVKEMTGGARFLLSESWWDFDHFCIDLYCVRGQFSANETAAGAWPGWPCNPGFWITSPVCFYAKPGELDSKERGAHLCTQVVDSFLRRERGMGCSWVNLEFGQNTLQSCLDQEEPETHEKIF